MGCQTDFILSSRKGLAHAPTEVEQMLPGDGIVRKKFGDREARAKQSRHAARGLNEAVLIQKFNPLHPDSGMRSISVSLFRKYTYWP